MLMRYRKHGLRHTKPYICEVQGCSRTEGFSTTNDLDRHTRSKHPSVLLENASAKKFRCHVPGCKSKDKAWPRLDNFRSHLKRVHQSQLGSEEAFDQMIRRYVKPNNNETTLLTDCSAEFIETEITMEPELTSAFPNLSQPARPVQESVPRHRRDPEWTIPNQEPVDRTPSFMPPKWTPR